MDKRDYTHLRYTLPHSAMVYPATLGDRLKYWFWRAFHPVHPYVRDAIIALRIYKYEGRQDYLIGKIAPSLSIEEIVAYLIEQGYSNHFIALEDPGEVVSLRYTDSFKYQYHIRVFEDGEVRAHYEFTPECHPILHMKNGNWEDRRHEFLTLLGHRIVPMQDL